VALTLNEVWIPSPNYSSRDPAAVRLLVLHTTEGATTIRNLGNFFASSSAGVSSHSGSDNAENFVFGAYVNENDKAWTQGNANPYCISLEQCTPSGAAMGWSRDYWLSSQEKLLRNGAYWVAYMAAKWNIPIVSLSASQAQDGHSRGVCDHVDLGAAGGGHSDCGPGYPMDQVIAWAKEYAGGGGGTTPPPSGGEPPQTTELDDMPTACIPYRPAGEPEKAIEICLHGPYKDMGFCADASVLAGPVKLRVALHIVNEGWDVHNVVIDPQHQRPVIHPSNSSKRYDGASIRRLDNELCDVWPVFVA
jgi:hypothetical protein